MSEPADMDREIEIRRHMLFGGADSISDAFPPRPQIACASGRIFREYCHQQHLNPNEVRWLHEVRHLRGLRGKVTVVVAGHTPFPMEFLETLRALADDGLIEVEEASI